MSWLAPLYLAALAAVALPVVFHLLRRTPRGRLPFSTLMFLSPSPPRLARRSRLENLLLLFLRAAVLVLLALAFARPFFREPANLAVDQQGNRSVAILVDASASMRRAGLWRQAVAEVNAACGDLRPGDDVALYAFDAEPRVVVPFRLGTAVDARQQLARLRAQLEQLTPTWALSDLGKALVAVADDLHGIADSRDEAPLDNQVTEGVREFETRRITVGNGLGAVPLDRQSPRNATSERRRGRSLQSPIPGHPQATPIKIEPGGATLHGFRPSPRPIRTVRLLVLVSDLGRGSRLDALQSYEWPDDVEIAVRPVTAAQSTNAGLHLAGERAGQTEPAEDDAVRVRVSNDSQSAREEFTVRWHAPDGTKPEDEPTRAYVPSGETRVIRVPRPAGRSESDRLVLAGDDHDFDNTLYLASARQEEVTLLYVGPDPPDDAKGLLYYFQRAFPQTAGRKVRVLVRTPEESLSAAELRAARLIAVVSAIGDPQADVLRQYIENGGTVLHVLADVGAGKALGRLAGREGLVVEEAKSDDYAMLGWIDFGHPLFSGLADPRYNDFTKIHFWKHRRTEWDDVPQSQILARFDDGSPALVELPQGAGRLLVLTAGWHPADSQLARSSKFVPLLAGLLERAGVADAALPRYEVGDAVSLAGWQLPAGGATVVKPDGTEVRLASDAKTFTASDQPGVYRLLLDGKEDRFAVNLSPAESQTAPMPVEQLEQSGVRLGDRRTREEIAAQERQMLAAELENHQKLWRWLVAVALGVLIVETGYAGWLARRAGRQDADTASAGTTPTGQELN